MNQKKIIVAIIIAILLIAGLSVYFLNVKDDAIITTQNNLNQQANIIDNNTTLQENNLTKLTDLGIELELTDGYDISKSEGKTTITFGPIEENVGPATGEKNHIYQLFMTPKNSADGIIAEIKKNDPEMSLMTVKPEIKTINNVTAVMWAEGGMCENRTMEVVGLNNNYRFFSLGCSHDQKFDFDYFEKIIKTIKFLN